MLSAKFATVLCLIIFAVSREVELTPIVTIPPENASTSPTVSSTESAAVNITASSSEIPNINSSINNIANNVSNDDSMKLGGNDTTGTELPEKGNETISSTATTILIQPVTRSEEADNQTEAQDVTIPELITKTVSSTPATNDTDEVTQLSVTSQSLSLKGNEETLHVEESTPPVVNENKTSVVDNPEKIALNVGNYKDKAPVEYHPYIEEILRVDEPESNETTTQSAPIRIKSKGYQSPHNALREPYGPLPRFAEKEMDKLRLNHWRVHQILKGSQLHDLGQPGTGKMTSPGKYSPPVPNVGQKRASSGASTYSIVHTPLDQDEFHSSILASHADAAMENDNETSPSKLRTFFNWISNPLKKKKPSEEDERLKQAKAQQPILPFALGYRGDFLFW